LNDEEKTRRDQSTYSEAYLAELSERIHKEADQKWAPIMLSAGETWSCPVSQCSFRPESTSKSYLIVHLQEYHNEDVGCTCEEELAGRYLDPLVWRCLNCLSQTFVHQSRYVCFNCSAPCEEFRVNARARLSSKENDMGTIQQSPSLAHASTIASSQSIVQGESSSLDTPMQFASQTLQPHLSLPEPVTTPRDASNAALELPVSTTAIRPTSPENRHQEGIVVSSKSSGSNVLGHPLFCVGDNCRMEFSTLTELHLHLEENHNASVIALGGILICKVRAIVLHNVKSTGLIVFYHQIVPSNFRMERALLQRRIRDNVGTSQASKKNSWSP
jgi:hypothetical protein